MDNPSPLYCAFRHFPPRSVERNGRARSERGGEQGRAKGKIASWAKKDEEEEEEESSEEGGDRRSPLDRHSANFSRIPNVR